MSDLINSESRATDRRDKSKIKKAFDGKKALIPFITGGDPDIETSEKLILALAEAGADIIEIGVPFSDPIAEGPVIQAADERALAGGTTTDALFELVRRVRGRVGVPLLFMTYINPVVRYGAARFGEMCMEVGADGVIVPDLPFEEKDILMEAWRWRGPELISLVTPVSGERARMIAKDAQGFLYCVSSLGVTGTRDAIGTEIAGAIEAVRQVSDIPCAVGFGISTPKQARAMAEISDGAIIGSAIVKIVAQYGRDSAGPVKEFVSAVRKELDSF